MRRCPDDFVPTAKGCDQLQVCRARLRKLANEGKVVIAEDPLFAGRITAVSQASMDVYLAKSPFGRHFPAIRDAVKGGCSLTMEELRQITQVPPVTLKRAVQSLCARGEIITDGNVIARSPTPSRTHGDRVHSAPTAAPQP